MLKSKQPFQLTGTFTAVREWRHGLPRHIEVQHANSVLLLKLGKELRGHFLQIEPGTELSLRGVAKLSTNGVKRKVTGLDGWPRSTRHPNSEITIQICSKKNCWKNGGRQLYQQLETRITENDLHHVRLEKTGCLGNCKHCPTACLPLHALTLGPASAEKFEHLLPA